MREGPLQRLRMAGWVVFGAILLTAMGFGVYKLLSGSATPQPRLVTTVTRVLLPPPPPPPPPPPKPPEPVKEDKPIEQPKLQEPKQEQARPKEPPKPNLPAAPPGNPLTAEAGAGANAYGLGVGNGGGDVIGGQGGGGGGRSWASYGSQIQAQLQAALARDDKLRFATFRAPMKLWFKPGGQVTRAQVVASSGDPSIDAAIEQDALNVTLADLPPDLPQPVSVRIQFSHR